MITRICIALLCVTCVSACSLFGGSCHVAGAKDSAPACTCGGAKSECACAEGDCSCESCGSDEQAASACHG